MTKAYALTRLLEHGPLLRHEIAEITGWNPRTLANTLWAMTIAGQLRRYREDGAHEPGFRLP